MHLVGYIIKSIFRIADNEENEVCTLQAVYDDAYSRQ